MTNQPQSPVTESIIIVLETNGGEIKGTEQLALAVNSPKHYIIKCARAIQRRGLITIVPSNGGRGNKTVYKRNRNQTGLPRKRKP